MRLRRILNNEPRRRSAGAAQRTAGDVGTMTGEGVPLAMTGEGDRVEVIAVLGGRGAQQRLLDLGLAVGRTLTVLNRQGAGGIVVAIGDTRLALGFGMATKVLVAPLGDGARD